jgi:hypothetical protein
MPVFGKKKMMTRGKKRKQKVKDTIKPLTPKEREREEKVGGE